LGFCIILSNDYDDIDAINAFNIFQTELRSFLEKSGFTTTTSLELKRFREQHAVIIGTLLRGIKNVTLIDRATNLYLDGYPTIEIQKITGPKTEASFLLYIKVTKLNAAKRLSAHMKKRWSEKMLRVA
jgi:hypothetical protein